MQLIDKEALMKWLQDNYCDARKHSWNYNYHVMAMDMIDILENYPAAEERQHGHWNATAKCYIVDGTPLRCYKCSVCNAVILEDVNFATGEYCSQCGAKMDEEVKE